MSHIVLDRGSTGTESPVKMQRHSGVGGIQLQLAAVPGHCLGNRAPRQSGSNFSLLDPLFIFQLRAFVCFGFFFLTSVPPP